MVCSQSAFADENTFTLDESGSVSAGSDFIFGSATDEQVQRIDTLDAESMLVQYANALASGDGTRATDYAYSIYQYLQSVIHPDLSSIDAEIISLNTSNTNVSNYASYICKALYGSMTSPSITANSSIWMYLSRIYSSLCFGNFDLSGVTTSSPIGDITLIKSMLTGTSGSIYQLVGSTMSSSASSASSLININTTALNISSSLSNIHNVFTDTSDLSFQYLNYIEHDQFGYSSLSDVFTLSSISEFENTQTGLVWWFKRSDNVISNNDKVYMVDLPVQFRARFYPDNLHVDFIYLRANNTLPDGNNYTEDFYYEFYDINFMVEQYGPRTRIYFTLPNTLPHTRYMGIVIYSDTNPRKADNNIYSYYVDSFDDRYYDVKNLLMNYMDYYTKRDLLTNVNKLTEVYASDEEVAARHESQTVIDGALDSFTGDGSASAKLSDILGAKDISDTLTDGLSSGGSVNNGLIVFDTSGNSGNSFYGWFTQEVKDWFAPLHNTRGLDNGVYDYLSEYDEEYYRLLGN